MDLTETGILNRDIAAHLSKMGHGDIMLITDAGLAVPNTMDVIDLSISQNNPTTLVVLDELLKHFSVEKIFLSQSLVEVNPSRKSEICSRFGDDVEVEIVPHQVLREELTKKAKFVIRSGDFTAFSNIVLVSAGGDRWYCEK